MDDDDDLVRPVGAVRPSSPARMTADRYDSWRSRVWLLAPPRKVNFPTLLTRLQRRKDAAAEQAAPADPVEHPLADSGTVGRLLDTEA